MLEQILANSDLVTSISIGAGFCSGLFYSGINSILQIKIDKQTIPASRIAIGLLLCSLFDAIVLYILISAFKILDASVSATELNKFSIYMLALLIILPFVERLTLPILMRFGSFDRNK